MARKKVRLAWIANDSTRRATFMKRKKGLFKKVSELCILCGVEACVIVYAEDNSEPDVWPSPLEVDHVLTRFKSKSVYEQNKKMLNHENFLMQRIAEMKKQLMKQQKDNRKFEITLLIYEGILGKGLQDVTIDELSDMAWLIEEKMKEIKEKIEEFSKEDATPPP